MKLIASRLSSVFLNGGLFKTLLTMKLAVLLIVAVSLQANAKLYSQRLTLALKNAPIEVAFKEIQKQSSFRFIYSESQVSNSRNVTLNVYNATLEEVLQMCFKGQPLTYTLFEDNIVVKIRSDEPGMNATITPPPIRGKITDENGNPVPGATILVKGTKRVTVTDNSGNFSIEASTGDILVISSVGFVAQEITLTSQGSYTIRLLQDTKKLEEVVITGYSTKSKGEFTGAASKVMSKQIEQVPMASFEQILQGRVPGLYIASGSGQPGSYARTSIRGMGTLGGGFDPLYVVDGIPIETGVFRTLNPNDFETVDVLKDAAGASLYGSRGANGVIVITTKKGKSGKPQLQFRTQQGVNRKPSGKFRMMNTQQRLQFEEEFLGPSGILPVSPLGLTGYPGWDYSPANPRYPGLTPEQKQTETARLDSIRGINTNWPDLFFNNAQFSSYEINASGGTQNLNFYTSLGAFKQEGVVIRSELERYTFKGNIDFKTDRLTVQVRTTAGWSKLSGIESEAGVALANPIAAAYLTLPYEKVFDDNGKILVGASKIGQNALDRLKTTTNLVNQFKGGLGVTISYKIWGGIGLKTTSGVDYRNNNTSRFIPPGSFSGGLVGQGQRGSYNEGNLENLQLISTSGITFNRTFNGVHSINAQALFEFIKNKARTFNATGFGLNEKLPNTPASITAGSPTNNFIPLIAGTKTENALYSIMALADYSYKRKYTISASVRRDAPSQLPERNRNNIFWSVGANWNALLEDFIHVQHIFQDLHLRTSYGSAANVNGFTSNFGYIPSYGTGGYSGVSGIIPTSPGNIDYKLESQAILNIGLDLTTWNGRVRGTIEWYNKLSKNLFANQPLSRTTGFIQLATNAGEVKNTGVEVVVNADVIKNKDWLVTLGGNISYTKNEITSLGSLSEFVAGTGIFRVGLPIGTHFVVGQLGVDPQTGNAIYQDINGHPIAQYLASNSRADFGTFLPKYTGGITLDARYKQFDFSMLFSFAEGVKRFNNERFFYEGGNAGFQFNQGVDMLQTWRKPGDITNFQRIGSTRQFTSKDINDASFIRLRNMQAGYTFNFKNGHPIRGFRLYVQAQNLITWTKWQGFDPEESNNIATYEFPNPRSYTIGLDVNF